MAKKGILRTYQEEAEDAGITPKLFLAAILKTFGFRTAKERIQSGVRTILAADEKLKHRQESDSALGTGSPRWLAEQIRLCNSLSADLTALNINLTGTQSRLHYIRRSAAGLMRDEASFSSYIHEEWPRWIKGRSVEDSTICTIGETTQPLTSLSNLNCTRYRRRDNDKLEMISRAMQQSEVDIKSLKAHIKISVALVGNWYSHAQLTAAERDSQRAGWILVVTFLFLPATFVAIVLTTPMPVLLAWPFGIWAGISLLLMTIIYLSNMFKKRESAHRKRKAMWKSDVHRNTTQRDFASEAVGRTGTQYEHWTMTPRRPPRKRTANVLVGDVELGNG